MNGARRRFLQSLQALPMLAALLPLAAQAEPSFSAAENDLFVADHLANVGEARQLVYELERSGPGQAPSRERIVLLLGERHADGGRRVKVQFDGTATGLDLPEIENARGNPVVLAFLERDVRLAQQLTGGQAAHFRRRLRLALADEASVSELGTEHAGRQVRARLIMVTPFASDLNRSRYGKLADKSYRFLLSPQVPGWVIELRTMTKDADLKTLTEEVMRLVEARP